MRKSHCFVLAIIFAGGLLTGFAVRRISPANFSNAGASGAARKAGDGTTSADSGLSSVLAKLPVIRHQRSNDTLESILKLDSSKNYGQIALWLADASEQDIAAYWAAFSRGDSDVRELICINWTRLNPRAAIAGSNSHYAAWQAWAANDPGAAMVAATAAGDEQVYQVAAAIGEYHPAWLRAHFDELPKNAKDVSRVTVTGRTDSEDPRESLDFLKKTGGHPDKDTFKALVRKDPWAAADWLKENPMFADQNNFTDVLYSTMSEEHPEDLERLAERTPPGDVRRKMEQVLFDRLLQSDPAEALEQARSTAVPLLASQRLGQIGLDLFAKDPAKALEIAGEILAKNPGNLDFNEDLEFPGGSMSNRSGGNAGELMDALFNKDPAGTVEMMMSHSAGETGISKTLENYVGKWAREDLEGFAQWTNQQSGKVRQVGADQIGYRLAEQGRYLESIEWSKSGTSDPGTAYTFALSVWQKADPQVAAAWLENSNLTSEQKAKYKETLKRFSQ